MPGGRAVDDDDVPVPAALELLDLAQHDDVVDARRRRGHDVDHPGGRRRLATRPKPCSRRYSSSASGGRDRVARRGRCDAGRRGPACRRARRRARAVRRRRPLGPEPPLPWSCRRLPCPPRWSRARRSDIGTGSTDSGGTFAQTSDRPAQRRGRPRPARAGQWLAGAAPRSEPEHRPRAPVDVLQVSGLFDPIVDRRHRRRHRPSVERRRPGPGAAGEHARRRRRPRRDGGAARAHRRRARCRSASGSARPAPACTGRRPSCSPSPMSPAWRPGRGSATPASRSARTASPSTSARPRPSCAADRSASATPARLDVFNQRTPDEGIPTIVNMVDALDGYERQRRRAGDDRGAWCSTTAPSAGTPRRRSASPSWRCSTSCSTPSPAPPVTYLLFLIGLALLIFEFFTAGVGIAGVVGAGCLVLACYGLADVAGPRLGGRAAHRWRCSRSRRRPGRHPAVLDRRRHRAHDHRQPVVVRAAARRRRCGRRGSR